MPEFKHSAADVYVGSDGDVTKAFYAELEKRGPLGIVAMNLFRAQKCSARAKMYRRRAHKGEAYDRKNWSMGLLCDQLALFASSTEDELQRAVAQCLDMNQISYMREARVSQTERPDFLIGTVAIEIKIDGSVSEVTRQIHRYAQREDIQEILVVTTCHKHLGLPLEFNGKSILVLWIGGIAGL